MAVKLRRRLHWTIVHDTGTLRVAAKRNAHRGLDDLHTKDGHDLSRLMPRGRTKADYCLHLWL